MSQPLPDPILRWVAAYVAANGQAPTADEVYAAINFRQPYGISRACESIVAFGELLVRAQRKAA
jgi:hypothetical protein